MLIVAGFAFMAYSYQTGTSRDLWIAYIVTGIPIAVAVVISSLILFLVVLRFATKRKIAKSRKVKAYPLGRTIWRNQSQILLPVKSIFPVIFSRANKETVLDRKVTSMN